jgi:hypothetical protein
MNPRIRHPVGRQVTIALRGMQVPLPDAGLALSQERNEATHFTAAEPDPKMIQAQRDIDAGQVDTDMHVTPGQNAARRECLVPGPGGKPPASGG